MGDGVPCHHVGADGCGIYERRPEVCRTFVCGWVMPNSPFPEDWRPDKVGFIIRLGIWDDERCWLLQSAGKDPTEEVLQKMREYTKASGEPHIIKKTTSWLCYGRPQFRQSMIKFAQDARRQTELRTDFLSST